MAVDTKKISLLEKEKVSIIKQILPAMNGRGFNEAVVMYSQATGEVLALNPPIQYDEKEGKERPQIYQEGRVDLFDPFFVIPRLYELRNWNVKGDKSTNTYMYEQDGTVQNLIGQHIGTILGDGTNPTVYNDGLDQEDKKLTDLIRGWSFRMGGRGKSADKWIIPWNLVDNFVTGNNVFTKYIGGPDDTVVDDGDLALARIDPRLYTIKTHDERLWREIVVFPIKQSGLPRTYKEFESWMPSYRGIYSPISSPGLVEYQNPIQLKNGSYYECSLFLGKAPVSSILSEMISTIELRFYRNKAYEKTALPPIMIKVGRHSVRDADDKEFMKKLGTVSSIGAELRTGDSIAYEGKELDAEGTALSEGWEITPLDLKSGTLDFATAFRLIDEQKAYGLRTSMAMLTSQGIEGQRHTLSTGANVSANVTSTIKTIRSQIRAWLVDIYCDYIFFKTNKKVKSQQINIQFTETREQDVAGFSNLVFGAFDRNLISMEEARNHLLRVGMKLEFKKEDELLEEMTEKQMALQGAMGGEGEQPQLPGEGEIGGGEGEFEEENEPFQKEAYPGRNKILQQLLGD